MSRAPRRPARLPPPCLMRRSNAEDVAVPGDEAAPDLRLRDHCANVRAACQMLLKVCDPAGPVRALDGEVPRANPAEPRVVPFEDTVRTAEQAVTPNGDAEEPAGVGQVE